MLNLDHFYPYSSLLFGAQTHIPTHKHISKINLENEFCKTTNKAAILYSLYLRLILLLPEKKYILASILLDVLYFVDTNTRHTVEKKEKFLETIRVHFIVVHGGGAVGDDDGQKVKMYVKAIS